MWQESWSEGTQFQWHVDVVVAQEFHLNVSKGIHVL